MMEDILAGLTGAAFLTIWILTLAALSEVGG